ncbi:hypothetical protein RSAG8_04024, partial [Rhizoctonia solani AG-8 WAC10335]
MERPFSRFKLGLYFFIGAIICQAVSPLIPAFDTSHLVLLNPVVNLPDPKTSPHYMSHDFTVDGHIDDLANSSPKLIPSPGQRWDALHYLDVALHGTYTYEHQYAFSLGVPIVLRLIHSGKELLFSLVFPSSFFGSINTQMCTWLADLIDAFLAAMLAAHCRRASPFIG